MPDRPAPTCDRPEVGLPVSGQPAPGRRRAGRRAGLAASVALLVVLAVGCHSDNTPTAYGPDVQASYSQACTGNVGEIEGTTTTLATSNYCDCTYNVFVNNVPFNEDDKKNRDNGQAFANYSGKDFVDIENDLKDNPNDITNTSVVPQDVQDKLSGCKNSSETTGTTPGGSVPVGPALPASGTTAAVSPSGTAATTPGTTPGTTTR
jgi:hypothetical protein